MFPPGLSPQNMAMPWPESLTSASARATPKKREYRFKAGLLGLDFATEGPIQKGRSSYLINYRYSTLSLLNKMGFHLVGEYVDHKFQDLSFNLSFPSKDRKSLLTLFGLGGLSREHYFPIPDTSLWVNTGDWEDEIRPSNMGALGLTYTRQLDDKSYLKAVVAGVGSDLRFTIDTFDTRFNKARINTEQYRSSRLVGTVVYNRKFSTRTRFKAGLIGNHILYKFFWDRFLLSDILVNGEGSTQLLQGYAQVSHNLTEKLVFQCRIAQYVSQPEPVCLSRTAFVYQVPTQAQNHPGGGLWPAQSDGAFGLLLHPPA